jgi:hypothetical protein
MTRRFARNSMEELFQQVELLTNRVDAMQRNAETTLPFRDVAHLPPGIEGQIVIAEGSGTGSGGSGIFFDTDPQVGGFLTVTTDTGGISMTSEDTFFLWTNDEYYVHADKGLEAYLGQGIFINAGGGGTATTASLEFHGSSYIFIEVDEYIEIVADNLQLDNLPDTDPADGANHIWCDPSDNILRRGT